MIVGAYGYDGWIIWVWWLDHVGMMALVADHMGMMVESYGI